MKNVTVIGSGSWGTALAIHLHKNGHKVTLWSFSETEAQNIIRDKEHKEFLPSVKFSEEITVTTDKKASVANAEFIVCAVPSFFTAATIGSFTPFFKEGQIIVNVSKGFDELTKKRLSQVIEEAAPMCKVAVLCGPSHAEEVSRGIPSALVSSSKDMDAADAVQDLFMSHAFRVYTNSDIIGVELGAALKNVIALVAGISDGLGYGDNTKAALMTRGMAEMARLGVAMGAQRHTFSGLSGIGDLIVTCTSMHSRNRRAGILIGQGKSLEETLKEVHMVVEGVNTAKVAYLLAKEYNVSMPICEAVQNVLYDGKDLKQAVYELMSRGKKTEEIALNDF